MLKKILYTLKVTILLWSVILIPLGMVANYITSNTKTDIIRWIDTFVETDSVNLAKTLSIEIEKTKNEIDVVASNVYKEFTKNPIKGTVLDSAVLRNIVNTNNHIKGINIYDNNGLAIMTTSKASIADIAITAELNNLNDNIHYTIEEAEDKSINVKYTAYKSIISDKIKIKGIYIEFTVDWKKYDDYLKQMNPGAFPRMFYIASPDFITYISMKSLPDGMVKERRSIALGLYLTKNISRMNNGIMDVNIKDESEQNTHFRVQKRKINNPKNISGPQLFLMVATDDDVIKYISDNVTSGLPFITVILTYLWLFLCLIGARFYNQIKEKLEIASTVTDSTPLSVVIFHVETGKIFQINSAAKTMFMLEADKKDDINMWDIFLTESDKDYFLNAVKGDLQILNYEIFIKTFSGTNLWSICSASKIVIEEKDHMVLAILDINKRKEMEKKLANNAEILEKEVMERTADLREKTKELEKFNIELEDAKKIADRANEAKSKFLTSVSNELKTPLNAIMGYSEILYEESKDRKDEVTASDLRKIIGSTNHLLALITEIMDLSTVESGKIQFFLENANVINIIKDVEGITMPLITENDNTLFLEYAKDLGEMYTDVIKLRQCLFNLISNASKFTELGKITLKASKKSKAGKDFIEFKIIDTGCGIDSENLTKIFDPTANAEISKNKKGAGLGLSITKQYVEALGGEIKVQSEVNVGSEFILYVPCITDMQENDVILIKNNHMNKEEENQEQNATTNDKQSDNTDDNDTEKTEHIDDENKKADETS